MAAGYRSLLAKHLGGASAAGPPGNRCPLPGYLGGAGALPLVTIVPGYRSMLAYWLGGACSSAVAPPQPGGGAGGGGIYRAPTPGKEAWLRMLREDDEEIAALIPDLYYMTYGASENR